MVHTKVQEPMDDNSLSALLKANQETHRTMMILHCRQSWEKSETIIGYAPPPTAATQTRHHADGPAEQGESTRFGPTTSVGPTPFGPTLTTRIAAARQLKMDNLLDHKTPAKGRDPPTDKGGRGTTNNLHKHSQPARSLCRTMEQEGPKNGSNNTLTTLWPRRTQYSFRRLAGGRTRKSHETRRLRTQAKYLRVFSRRQ